MGCDRPTGQGLRSPAEIALLRRQAIHVVATLPDSEDDALLILRMAEDLVARWRPPAGRGEGERARLVVDNR